MGTAKRQMFCGIFLSGQFRQQAKLSLTVLTTYNCFFESLKSYPALVNFTFIFSVKDIWSLLMIMLFAIRASNATSVDFSFIIL